MPNAAYAVAVLLGGNHYQGLTRSATTLVTGSGAPYLSLVHFYSTAEFIAARPHHRPAQLVEHCPGSLVTAKAQYSLHSQGTGAVLLTGDIPHRPEPERQRQMAVLENCTGRHGGLVSALGAHQTPTLGRPGLGSTTPRTYETVWPTEGHQIRTALLVGRETRFQLQKRPRIIFDHADPLQVGPSGVNRIARLR